MICPKCKRPVEEDKKFCMYCGADLRSAGKRPKKKKSSLFTVTVIICSLCLAVILICGGILLYQNTEAYRLNKQLDLGNRYLAEGRYEEAELHFNRALEYDEESAEAELGLAEVYTQQKEPEKAARVVDRASTRSDNMTGEQLYRLNNYRQRQAKPSITPSARQEKEYSRAKNRSAASEGSESKGTETAKNDIAEIETGDIPQESENKIDETAAEEPESSEDDMSVEKSREKKELEEFPEEDTGEEPEEDSVTPLDKVDSPEPEEKTEEELPEEEEESSEAPAEEDDEPSEEDPWPEDGGWPDDDEFWEDTPEEDTPQDPEPEEESLVPEDPDAEWPEEPETPEEEPEMPEGENEEPEEDDLWGPEDDFDWETEDYVYPGDEQETGTEPEPGTEAETPAEPDTAEQPDWNEEPWDTAEPDGGSAEPEAALPEAGNPETEEPQAEIRSAADILNEYMASLPLVFDLPEGPASSAEGIIAARVEDIDSDGQEELIVIELLSGELGFTVYESDGTQAIMAGREVSDCGFRDGANDAYKGTQTAFRKGNGIGIATYQVGRDIGGAPGIYAAVQMWSVDASGSTERILDVSWSSGEDTGDFLNQLSGQGLSGSWILEGAGLDLVNQPELLYSAADPLEGGFRNAESAAEYDYITVSAAGSTDYAGFTIR